MFVQYSSERAETRNFKRKKEQTSLHKKRFLEEIWMHWLTKYINK